MSAGSRFRVTITLGRTGQENLQVVKMGEHDVDGYAVDVNPVAVKKRSILERLGEYADSSDDLECKRFRGDPRSVNAVDENFHPGKDDLRHKIMQKNRLKDSHWYSPQGDGDLRNFLSRPSQSCKNSVRVSSNIKRRKFTGVHPLEPEDYIKWVDRDHRVEHIRESRDGGRGVLEREIMYRMPGSSGPNMSPDLPRRPSENILQRGPRANSYSPWNLDQLRKKSPDEAFVALRRDKDMQRRSPLIHVGMDTSIYKDVFEVASKRDESIGRRQQVVYDGSNTRRNEDTFKKEQNRDERVQRRCPLGNTVTNTIIKEEKGPLEISRPTSIPYSTNMGCTGNKTRTEDIKEEQNRDESVLRRCPLSYTATNTIKKEEKDTNVAPLMCQTLSLLPMPPSLSQSGVAPSSTDTPESVESFLRSLGLERLAFLFEVEEVDMPLLKRMPERELAELGIPMGPRKQILFALQSLRVSKP